MNPYGIDCFFFPRARIDSFQARERTLDLVCGGSHVSLPLARSLLEAAQRCLS